jgi:hypothetical protein
LPPSETLSQQARKNAAGEKKEPLAAKDGIGIG